MSDRKYKKHRNERIVAWMVTLVLLALVGAGVYFGVKYLKAPVSEKVSSILKPEKAESEPEPVEEPEPEEQPVEEGIDEEKLNAIFDKDEEEPEEEREEKPEDDPLMDEAARIVEKMSLEQQVAQMFFVEPESITGVDVATAAGEKTRLALLEHPVGGVILFGKNMETPEQVKTMNSNLQKFSEESVSVPMFIGVDEEGGSVVRVADNPAFNGEEEGGEDGSEDGDEVSAADEDGIVIAKKVPTMEEIGKGKEKDAYEAGETIGGYLKEYGFNLDFAPVADVAEDGVDNALGDRIFSSDPQRCAGMVSSYLSGLHDSRILGCVKHFPGLGSVTQDTHEEPAVIDRDWGELSEKDLVPFKRAIDEKVKFIMVSHASIPEVTGDEIPASLSGIILTEKLRLDMGYDGIIITDALNMAAVTKSMSDEEAVLAAVRAGADMVLMPKDFIRSYEAVLAAVEEGNISAERIAESVRRIVYVKLFLKENG